MDPAPSPARSAILAEVRALIAEPARWCKRTEARDAAGFAVDPLDWRAAAWCVSGAFRVVASRRSPAAVAPARDLFAQSVETMTARPVASLNPFNDGGTHERVMEAFDLAEAAARRSELASEPA